jgi:glutamyl-tRNA synthetase
MSGVRFAPSPTGELHVGNLRTAWISREWAAALGLPWVVRFEDIDRPRVVAGAQDRQLADMAQLGLHADRVEVQSAFARRHWELFERARAEGRVYPCFCSRKEVQEALAAAASAPHGEPPVYNGRCRERGGWPSDYMNPTLAWRFRGPDAGGAQDFIVARTDYRGIHEFGEADFAPAYHWACAIDDFDGGFALLVRAWDLGPVTEQHRIIHRWLGESEGAREFPAVFHASLVTQPDGHRLEKRTRGVTLRELLARGLTPEAIVARFAASFAITPDEYAPARVWGEAAHRIPLSRLGL